MTTPEKKPNRATRRHPPKPVTYRVKQLPLADSPAAGETAPRLSSTGTGAPDGDEASETEAPPYAPHDRAPESGRRRRGRPPKQSVDDRIYSTLVQVYGATGLLIYPFNAYDGQLITSKAEDCAKGWLGVARQHAEVYRVLAMLSASNAYLLLATSHLAIIMGIAANHQMIPAQWIRRMGYQNVPEPPPAEGPAPGPAGPLPGSPMASPREGGMTAEQWAAIQAEAERQATIQRAAAQAAAMATQQQSTNGGNYNPMDTAARPEQDPAALMRQMGRRE